MSVQTSGAVALSPDETTQRLRAAGVPLAAEAVVHSLDEVVPAARGLGVGSFVVKAGGLLHKSDDGGVVLDLTSPDEVRQAADELVERLGDRAFPLVVQERCQGMELLVGVRRAGRLGAAIVVGAGGVTTEVFRDVARSMVPVDRAEARQMLERLQIWPLLEGWRGERPRDVDAVCELLVAVSELAESAPEIVELDLNPVLVGSVGDGVVAVDARISWDAGMDLAPARPAGRDLTDLLEPRHIAVVGVSDDPKKFGAKVFRYLRSHGFPGRVDAVHPAGGTVDGQARLRALAELDAAPDLVIAAVPARAVPDVAREAVRIGAGAMLVHSSDFAEVGQEGQAVQQELADILDAAGIPLAGPNSMGIVAPRQELAASISAGLESIELVAGSTALVTSSGALGSCLATRLMDVGLGLSHWIHVGNEADLTVADYLDWLADDPNTSAVGLLLEDIKDGPRLIEAGRRLAQAGKPAFAYNMARSDGGQVAAMSHTGAMVGSFEIREEVLRRAGIVSVATLRILEDALQLAKAQPLPTGDRVVALTFSGGACTIIADEAQRLGLRLPPLSAATIERVRQHVPSFAAVRNPLDVSFQMVSDPHNFREALRCLLSAGEFDAALVQFTTNADPNASQSAQVVLEVMSEATIPLYVGRYGGAQLAPKALTLYADASVPVLDAPDRAMQAIAALVRSTLNRRASRVQVTSRP